MEFHAQDYGHGKLMGCLTPADMLSAVQFLRGSDDGVQNLPIGTSPVCHSDKGELPIRRHCVHVETDTDEGAVRGYLELFGTFTAIAVLGTNYTGPVSKWTYCIDPLTGTNLTDVITVDLTASKRLMEEACRSPERLPEIWVAHAPDLQPLIDECLHARGVVGDIAITETSYGPNRPEEGLRIHDVRSLSRERSESESSS